jgi:Uma2 family endonuclease
MEAIRYQPIQELPMTQVTAFPSSGMSGIPPDANQAREVIDGQGVIEAAVRPSTEDGLYEVVNGQRVEKPPMSTLAGLIAFALAFHVQTFAAARKLGRAGTELLFHLDPGKNLQRRPDAAFVSFARWAEDRPLPHTDPWPVVPEIVAEVISPTNLAESVLDRVAEYFQAGVQLVWFVYPRHQQIYVYESPTRVRILTQADEIDGGSVLSGFQLPLPTLFGAVPQAG